MSIHGTEGRAKGYKGLQAGFRKELVRKDFDDKGAEAAIARARKLKIKESTVRTWMSRWRNETGQTNSRHIGIRDLQKMSGETITALPGPTPVKSGDRTVAILVPIKPTNVEGMDRVLAWAEELAKGRDPKADDEALRQFGDVDPTDWNKDAVRKIKDEWRKSRVGKS